jgi:EAL domain-containing protein (putative c-di-GMP-specific phosphodiesterase class I)
VPGDFAQAILEKSLSIVMQPIQLVGASPTSQPTYFEVLLRINNGTPISFLNRLTSPDDLQALDWWVMQQVCYLPNLNRYAVNLSPYSLGDQSFVRRIGSIRSELVIEVTERHAIELNQVEILLKLCDDFPVLLDDIGEAYSGLNRLLTFNFHGIKIDGHLILQVEHNLKARAIVGGLMRMARDLGICCVCEYVETMNYPTL